MFLRRQQGSNTAKNPQKRRTTFYRLHLEGLEPRQMLSATSLQSDHLVVPAAGSSVSGYTPAQIRAAYGFNNVSLDGSGQTIAIIDAYNDPNIASDLAVFDQTMGIAAPPSLKIVNQNGGSSLPGTDPSQGWEGETALDVEWAHAIAPGANIILVEANSASDSDLFAAVNYARQQTGVSVISMSWGSTDSAADASQDQALANAYLVTPAGHQGITFVASSGDTGSPSFPAESPNVLAVGGTDLYLTSSGSIQSETAWTPTTSGSTTYSGGGGVSQEFSGRKVPDVSYNAGVGYAVYDTFGPDHGWVSVGGTSAGAPQWSALIALADQGRAAAGEGTLNGANQTLAAIYAAPASDFHDITTGSTQFESAGVGYDLATGRGSPVANSLIPYLVSYGSTGGSTGGGTTGGGTTGGGTTTNPVAPANFTATANSSTQVTLNWTDSAGAANYRVYELVGGHATVLATLGSTASSYSISNLAAGSTYSFAVAAFNPSSSATTSWTQVSTPATSATLAAPQNVQATAPSSTAATVSWSASLAATGYQVYEWNGSQAVLVATVGQNTTSVTINGQTPGATEEFYVAATIGASQAASDWVSVVMPAASVLSAPTHVVATATSATTGTLSWTGSAGASGYQVYYWNGSQATLIGSFPASTTSVTITGMQPGMSYSFEVVAYNSTTSVASGWTTLTTPLMFTSPAAADRAMAQAAESSKFGEWWL